MDTSLTKTYAKRILLYEPRLAYR